MADKSSRLPQNVPGPFYVDATCTDCDLCRSIAPDIFRRDDASGSTYVFRQPTTPAEWAQAQEGVDCCPTESIGNDGTPVEKSQPVT
jgi:ferredoxin